MGGAHGSWLRSQIQPRSPPVSFPSTARVWRTESSTNRSAAGDRVPCRCTRTRSRIAGGVGRATTAPRPSAISPIATGTSAAPAPATTRGGLLHVGRPRPESVGAPRFELAVEEPARRRTARCHDERHLSELNHFERILPIWGGARREDEHEFLSAQADGLQAPWDIGGLSQAEFALSGLHQVEEILVSSGAARSTLTP